MLRLLYPVVLLWSAWVSAQDIQYAPDLRSDGAEVAIGLVNPYGEEVALTLSGYDAEGNLLASQAIVMQPYSRVFGPMSQWFDSFQVTWARLESQREVAAYVSVATSVGMALVPFSRNPGSTLYSPQTDLAEMALESQTVMLRLDPPNQPFQSVTANPIFKRTDGRTETTHFQALEAPLVLDLPEQAQVVIPRLQDPLAEGGTQAWNSLSTAGTPLAGIERISCDGCDLALLALERSPAQERVISHLSKDTTRFWTRIVLVNTSPAKLPVTLASYLDNGTLNTALQLDLDPYEKRIVRTELLDNDQITTRASWVKVTSFEQNLIAYQLFGTPGSSVIAAMESALPVGAIVNLAHTPTVAGSWTGIGIVNTSDQNIYTNVTGYDDNGNVIAQVDDIHIDPHGKKLYTTVSLFGEAAQSISWSKVKSEEGSITAFAIMGQNNGQSMAGLTGQVQEVRLGNLFEADFEHHETETLFEQGWVTRDRSSRTVSRSGFDGFQTEKIIEPQKGQFYVRSNASYMTWPLPVKAFRDAWSFESPVFQVPDVPGPFYLTYNMRVVNPELAGDDARYGLIWRYEGSDQWQWFGMSGRLLMEPPRGQFERRFGYVFYQDQQRRATDWLPFQMALPAEARGRRIQVAAYFDIFRPFVNVNSTQFVLRLSAPTVLWDNIRLQLEPLQDWIRLAYDGQGSVTEETP